MDSTVGQRKLIPRGAMPSALAQQKLSSFAQREGKGVAASIQCDSGFGDDKSFVLKAWNVMTRKYGALRKGRKI